MRRFVLCLFVAACGSSASTSDAPPTDVPASTPPDAPPPPPPSASGAGPARIDEIGYVAALHQKRPDLFTVTSVCYDNLVLRPELRSKVLDENSSYADIVTAQYTTAQRNADLAWITDQQATEKAFCTATPGVGGCANVCPSMGGVACGACPAGGFGPATGGALPQVWPSGYSLCAFVGWAEGKGPGGAKFDTTGVVTDWKVLGELRDDYATTFTGAKFQDLANELAKAGFRGDAKTTTDPDLPEQVRMQYNNVIVHGWSPSDGKIAEKVLDAFFGDALVARGRGVDVKPAGASAAMDWHHFLCAYDVSTLSDVARAYVTYAD